MWALTLEYINHAGNDVLLYFPAFRTEADCTWWMNNLWPILRDTNDARELISSACSRVT